MKISPKLMRVLKRSGLKLKHAAPSILLGGGVVSILTGTVLACVATSKNHEVLTEHESRISTAEAKAASVESLKRIYFSTILKFLKLYAPAGIAIILGFVMIFGSHSILKNRNAMLSAELLSVTQAFNAYRERVEKQNGKEADEALAYDDCTKTDKDGNKQAFEKADVENSRVKYFSKETSDIWVDNSIGTNETTVELLRNDVQRKKDAGIPVMMSEIYRRLGLPQTKAGHYMGYLPKTDKLVDFHAKVIHGEYKRDGDETIFERYPEPVIRLEFNHDGYILDKLDYEEA